MKSFLVQLVKADRHLTVFIPAHALLFLGLFMLPALFFYPNTGRLELAVSSLVFQGYLPYRDFPFEYPPLALLFFLVPRLFFDTLTAYSFAFAFEMLMADIMILFLIGRLAPRPGASPWHRLAVYTLLVMAAGPLAASRYDLWPAALLLLALFAFTRGMTGLAWAALALNIGAKLYGAVIIPLFIIYHLVHRQYRRLLEGTIVSLAVSLALVLPWLIIDPGSLLSLVGYHLGRGIHAESTYGALLLVGQLLGIGRAIFGYASGSWNVYSPGMDWLAGISLYLSLGSLAVLYLVFARVLQKRRNAGKGLRLADSDLLIEYSLLVVLVLLVTAKSSPRNTCSGSVPGSACLPEIDATSWSGCSLPPAY